MHALLNSCDCSVAATVPAGDHALAPLRVHGIAYEKGVAPLDARLASFHADATELEISVKDREARGQKVTLECWIGGREKINTTSQEGDLHAAVRDVRDDLRRRLTDAKTRQEPRSNRHLRERPEVDAEQ